MTEPTSSPQSTGDALNEWLSRVDLREHEEKILLFLSLVVSALVGLIVVGFVVLTERLGVILVTATPWQRVLTPLLGSLVGGILLYRFFPSARGSGIPQTRVALVLQKGTISLRTVIGKFLCSSLALGSGVALGREGPSVHIGAGVASVAGRRLGLSDENVKSLIPVGTAAAVAAAFNTPLAAVLFTLEEILADLHARVVGSVVIGAATSWIVLRLILGDEPLFHVPAYELVHPLEFLIYGLLGLLGGLVSTGFVKLLLWQRKHFMRTPARWKPFAPAVGGLTVGLLALIAPGVLGVGYNLVSEALNGQLVIGMMLLLLVLKGLATATCYSSGNAGGIFGPSLFIGAMLGGSVGQIAHLMLPDYTGNAGAYALVGMGAAFAGIVRTPMTSVIMIFEVTRDYTIIVPLMIANLCSYLLAQRLQKLPIYEALSEQDGIQMPSAAHRPEPLRVEQAMRPEPPGTLVANTAPPEGPYVHPDDTLDSALQRMAAASVDELPVVNRAGGYQLGVVGTADAMGAYRSAPRLERASKTNAGNWLPALGIMTVASVLIVSGLVVWQRSRRTDLASEARVQGEELMVRERPAEAVAAFRSALAHTPRDSKLRASLGLALVQTGHFDEAASYLTQAVKVESESGPVWTGLAKIALASGDHNLALRHFKQALSKDWPPDLEPLRRAAQFDYAGLLVETNRKGEAIALYLTMIGQQGDDPVGAKKAADMMRTVGSAEQAEEAYNLLATRFPADPSVWLRLGDARFAAGKDRPALTAYRESLKSDPSNIEAVQAVARVENVIALDPTRRDLSVRERARRWDAMLERVLGAAGVCGHSAEIEKAAALQQKKRPLSIETSDMKMDAAIRIWQATGVKCKADPVLSHVMAKVIE